MIGIRRASRSRSLDKAGGLTEALAPAAEAKRRGLRIMVDSVISTSLWIAPVLPVAQQAEIVDPRRTVCIWHSITPRRYVTLRL
jgi:L-alanine-DL-glutamate epimerase-like enolase superfamily enzyme